MDVPSPRWLIALVIAPIAAGGAWLAWDARSIGVDLATPRDLHDAEHATSGECQRCHPAQFESWASTFHRTMTQDATETSVLGDFDDARLEYGGVEARMQRTPAAGFEIRFLGPGGREWSRAEVVRTVGTRRYQQYLARDGDLYFRLPVAWHVEEGRWFHMNGAFLTPDPEQVGSSIEPSDYYRHVTRWNDNCVFCHNVAANPGQDGDQFETEVAELGIACEACHGPADEHTRVNSDPVRRYALHLSDDPDPTIVNPRRLSPERSADVCGRCHGQRIASDVGRFMRDGDPFVPGEDLLDYTRPLARDTSLNGDPDAFTDRFWSDGTARLTAYEFQGLLDSPCDGLTCTTCHGMHEGDPRGQIRPSALGDRACAECHEELVREPSSHSHHERVECADCHMPRIVYGLIGVHRSHRIENPVPTSTRPDACSLCHADRNDTWIRSGFTRLFGVELDDATEHHDAWPRAHRDALSGDPIERAVAVAALGRRDGLRNAPRRAAILLDTLIEDPYPAVRRIAHRSLARLGDVPPGFVAEASREQRERYVNAARALIEHDSLPSDEAAGFRAAAAQEAIFIGE